MGIQNRSKYGIHSLAVTVTLMLLMVGITYAVFRGITGFEREECFDRLYYETEVLAQSMELSASGAREKLQLMAALAVRYGDLADPQLWEILSSTTLSEGMASLAILLPDDTVLTSDGRKDAAQFGLSFEEEAVHGEHFSDRKQDETGAYIIRSFTPILDQNETIGILFYTINLNSFSEAMRDSVYGGEGALYIIDGRTGDFLMDTWHAELGNIWELGGREMAEGYDHERLRQELTEGESNYVVFVSESIGEYLYFYYEPLEINEWRIAVSVPENVVFHSAYRIRSILTGVLVFEIVSFSLYFLWILRNSRYEAKEKQSQLDSIRYIYDVEKLLFNAHERKENIDLALEKIGYIISAQRVVFWLTDMGKNVMYLWSGQGDNLPDSGWQDGQLVHALKEYFSQGYRELEAESPDEIERRLPGVRMEGLRNLLAVPVKDVDGAICGILMSCNQDEYRMSTLALKGVSFSFRMFCHNLMLYNTLKEQSEKDSLTGLKNRNRYELDLKKLLRSGYHSLVCIYIDVNGLHELNNTRGHDAGDRMLQMVAAQLRTRFGERYVYRIGGDEFLVFLPDIREETVKELCSEMTAAMEEQGLHVSVGIHWGKGDVSITDLIKEAEQKMYTDKRKFYEQEDRDGRQRRRDS